MDNDDRYMEQMFGYNDGNGYWRLGWSHMVGRVDLG